jgi:hypothetical protein
MLARLRPSICAWAFLTQFGESYGHPESNRKPLTYIR